MKRLTHLFENNNTWAAGLLKQNPQFFAELSEQQSPEYLWIGCSDSRVPANQITGLKPGEVFVHRNIANQVVHSDLNCLSVIQFAIDVLKVKHVMVVGHYGCGGVRAALENSRAGLVDNWLGHVRDVGEKHAAQLADLPDNGPEECRLDRFCELNVLEQVLNVANTTMVRDAWSRDQDLTLHGWIYSIRDGLLRDLGMCVTSPEEVEESYAQATKAGQKARLLRSLTH